MVDHDGVLSDGGARRRCAGSARRRACTWSSRPGARSSAMLPVAGPARAQPTATPSAATAPSRCGSRPTAVRSGAATGVRVVEAVTFDPAPALRAAARAPARTPSFAVEELGVGFRVSGDFPEASCRASWSVVPFEELTARPGHPRRRPQPRPARPRTSSSWSSGSGCTGSTTPWAGPRGWTSHPEGVSKAQRRWSRSGAALGVQPADTIAVGDGRNDLEMLAWAAHGVAMGSAPPEVLAVADEVCRTSSRTACSSSSAGCEHRASDWGSCWPRAGCSVRGPWDPLLRASAIWRQRWPSR